MTLGQWLRAIDLVLEGYAPQDESVEDEADRVVKLTLLIMLTRWYDEEDICLLTDSSALRLPTWIMESSRREIAKILDRPPSDEGLIEDYMPEDPDAPPNHTGRDQVPDEDDKDPFRLLVPPY